MGKSYPVFETTFRFDISTADNNAMRIAVEGWIDAHNYGAEVGGPTTAEYYGAFGTGAITFSGPRWAVVKGLLEFERTLDDVFDRAADLLDEAVAARKEAGR